jgi:3-deoxy-7-phosphoheptulonate synthase
MLDPLASSYLADTASWISIGARTVESQIHRDAASGLPVPVGFKNSTGGSVVSAVHAIAAARQSHACLGIDNNGKACIVRTRGNHLCHLVLRGGTDGPNANTRSIETAAHLLRSHGLPEAIIIDCSHMNSGKDHRKQGPVCESAVAMRSMLPVIKGIMLESYLRSGSQVLSESRDSLQYGVSITDSCMSWKETEALLRRIRTYLVESPCTRNPMREQRCAMRQA